MQSLSETPKFLYQKAACNDSVLTQNKSPRDSEAAALHFPWDTVSTGLFENFHKSREGENIK